MRGAATTPPSLCATWPQLLLMCHTVVTSSSSCFFFSPSLPSSFSPLFGYLRYPLSLWDGKSDHHEKSALSPSYCGSGQKICHGHPSWPIIDNTKKNTHVYHILNFSDHDSNSNVIKGKISMNWGWIVICILLILKCIWSLK